MSLFPKKAECSFNTALLMTHGLVRDLAVALFGAQRCQVSGGELEVKPEHLLERADPVREKASGLAVEEHEISHLRSSTRSALLRERGES